ncbi:MAG: hypothetical protein QM680_03180 [Luteolibacter sp.]
MKLKPVCLSAAVFGTVSCAAFGQAPPPLRPLPKLPQQAPASVPSVVPVAVIQAAVGAVEKLGDEVVQGNYQAAIDSLNPMWKERTASRVGGMQVLDQQLSSAADEMVKQGIRILSFKPAGLPRGYEVWPGKKVETINGESVETLIYTKWLVFVPTVKTFEMRLKGDPKPVVIQSTGFQVAVCDKDKTQWTFIDGSSTSLNELRGIFITLPADTELPPLEKHEVR